MLTADESQYVLPYYLKMMRLNAIWHEEQPPIAEVRKLAKSVPTETVVTFLRGFWRPRVMGAWYALGQQPETIGEELCRSLETSAGTLTSPPLAVVAVHMLGATALPALEAHHAAAASDPHVGGEGFIAAAIEHVGGARSTYSCADSDRDQFAQMLQVARTIGG